MKYLADILTFSRLVLAIVLLVLAIIGGTPESAFLIFLVAELTDTFDGTCARKWPFPKDKEPKYRKYAAMYDMFSDVMLATAQVLYVTLQINVGIGLAISAFYVIICGGIELLVYGKLLGHPDNCEPWSLTRRNFPLAKKIILVRRYCYALCLGLTSAVILFATRWPLPVKIALVILGCLICVFAWFFLEQRRHNISRDAVKIEKRLARRARQQAKRAMKKANAQVKKITKKSAGGTKGTKS